MEKTILRLLKVLIILVHLPTLALCGILAIPVWIFTGKDFIILFLNFTVSVLDKIEDRIDN